MLIVKRHGSREADRIQREMEEIFRSLVIGSRSFARTYVGSWRPPVEVYESDDALIVTMELAGIRDDDVRVIVDDSAIHIRGVRENPVARQKRIYHEMGIAYGAFEAEVFLPFPVELDQVDAVYENGYLRVVLPRVRATRIVPVPSSDEPPATG